MSNEWDHGGSIDWRIQSPPSYGLMWLPWVVAILAVAAVGVVW